MKNILALVFIGLLFVACSKDSDDDTTASSCDFELIVSAEEYANAPSAPLSIQSLEIEGSCLKVNFSASGCDGNTWEVKLIDSGTSLDSDPPQRSLRVSLENLELCQAVFTRELTFDLSKLEAEGKQIRLNIENNNESILYSY